METQFHSVRDACDSDIHDLHDSKFSKYRQMFSNPKCYLLFFCLIGILQGAYFSYFVGILSTLEKRYSFDSSVTGIILIADNLSPALFSIFMGYYGKRFHRPKLITFSMMVSVFSCFLCCLPYLLYGSVVKRHHTVVNNTMKLCDHIITDPKCDNSIVSESVIAVSLFFLANFLNGFGSIGYYTIGTPYLDDSVKKRDSPLYIGTKYVFRVIGPTLGFMLSSFCLSFYENPFIEPGFEDSDSRWIGAWWVGLIILGIALFIVSFPVAYFPEQVQRAHLKETSIKTSLLDLVNSLKKLVKNPILVFHTLSITFQINGIFGYFVFMPKYMESQYQKSASSASFFSGNVALTAVAVGIFASGFFIKKYEPKPRYLTGYMLFVQVFGGLVLLSALFLGCQNTTLGDRHLAKNFALQSRCQNCSCDMNDFSPICDTNGNTYVSPCAAGCQNYSLTQTNKFAFHDCTCIPPRGNASASYEALSGFCDKNCAMFLPYIIVISLSKILSSTARVGNVLISLRCVDEKDKTLALGAVEFVVSIFATIPYPLLYGYVIDKTCLIWDHTCEKQGNCWLYDRDLFRLYFHGLSIMFILVGALCDSVVFFMSSRIKNFYGSDHSENEEETKM